MYSHCPLVYCAASDVWVDEPTSNGLIVYSVITPLLALCGIIGNLLSLLIITRREYGFGSSTYTYLSVLAATDLLASVFLLISGLCRGVLWWIPGWREYEAIIAIPFGGTFTCWAVTAVVAVTFDRVVYLWNPTRTTRPAFCQQKVARLVMLAGLCISILFNVPYCFMYTWDYDGELISTSFMKTTFYTVHSWSKLVTFAILPALLLLMGNAFLIRSLKRMHSLSVALNKRCNKINKAKDSKWVTITLVSMVFFFLIGEIPSNLVSRTSAVTLLFWGDEVKADASKTLELFRQIATLMNGVYLAVNFFIYYMFCAHYRKMLCSMFACCVCPRTRQQRRLERSDALKRPTIPQVTQVNVFIVGGSTSASEDTKCDKFDGGRSWPQLTQFNRQLIKLLEENKLAVNIVTSSKIY